MASRNQPRSKPQLAPIELAPVTSSDLKANVMPGYVKFNACPLGLEYQNYWDLLDPEEQTWELDVQGLYSITVKSIATDQANRLLGNVVLDLFCGCGGNSIAFARAGKKVIAVDNDQTRLAMAKHNAELAGVADKIEFIQSDAIEFLNNNLSQFNPDAIFLDPPWGGPGYVENKEFPLDGFNPDGKLLLDIALSQAKHVAIKLPDNFKFIELDSLEHRYKKVSDYLGNKMLHYTAYFDSPNLNPA